MNQPKPILFLAGLFLCLQLSAQLQWYQNQDGNNPPPAGTIATSIQPFGHQSFVACYFWNYNGDQNTWKISRSAINGAEQRTFFLTGPSATAEIRTGNRQTIYVLERNFPVGLNPGYKLYKLNGNLVPEMERNIQLPGDFSIFNLNAFELDAYDNIYLAGDGQYPDGPGFSPASFVMKMDKNLAPKWKYIDSSQTSFTRLHPDDRGHVWVIEDFYTFFPEVRIKKLGANGALLRSRAVQTDINRYTIASVLDKEDNILLYGGKFMGDTAQAMYLMKVSRHNGYVIYNKTHFSSASSQINDFKLDRHGNLFSLVTQYFGPDRQVCKISRINSWNGNIIWNRSLSFSQDSCNLQKLVMDESERFYAVGEKKSNVYYSKGFAMRMKKNGQMDGNYPAPDSVAFQRSHWLSDGITDRNGELIVIGSTTDLETNSFTSTYFRSFAAKYGRNNNNPGCDDRRDGEPEAAMSSAALQEDVRTTGARLAIFPNPVQQVLTVTNIGEEGYTHLSVYDLNGTRLLQQNASGNNTRVDVSKIPAGVYMLVLRSSATQKEQTLKFVIKR
jgi:hypothetical protein